MEVEKRSPKKKKNIKIQKKKSSNIENKNLYRERNAQYKRNKEEKYRENGFINTKIYLGRDVYERLAEIYEDLLGEKLNFTGRKNTDDLSRVISYCIVKLYKAMYIRKNKGNLDNIEPARTIKAQQLYDLYQAVLYRSVLKTSYSSMTSELSKSGLKPPDVLFSTRYQYRKDFQWDEEKLLDLMDLKSLNKRIYRTAN
ncbi:hypothetical protein C1P00_03125 [Salmonella enterica]|nr:hypothetical protein [Salmonella enterica]